MDSDTDNNLLEDNTSDTSTDTNKKRKITAYRKKNKNNSSTEGVKARKVIVTPISESSESDRS